MKKLININCNKLYYTYYDRQYIIYYDRERKRKCVCVLFFIFYANLISITTFLWLSIELSFMYIVYTTLRIFFLSITIFQKGKDVKFFKLPRHFLKL